LKHPPSASARALASRLLMGAAVRLLGTQRAAWARAMRAELTVVPNEREALAFAWGCLWAALGHALAAVRGGLAQVHNASVLGCAAAVLAGCGFMHAAAAPGHYVWTNLLSLAFAVAMFRWLPRRHLQADELLRARLSFAIGALLLTASLAQAPGEASVWLRIGPATLNLVWLLLPALLVASDVRPASAAARWALSGLSMAVGALALQADALLLGLVAAVLGVRAWQQGGGALALLALASAALAARLGPAWQAPQALAFVDRVVDRGFEQGLITGLVLALLQVLPLWPVLRHRRARQHGLVWGLLVAVSLPGWLPSPWLGFGGSLIVGYLLSLAFVGADAPQHPAVRPQPVAASRGQAPPTLPRSGLI
jgi:hypothetical protein